MRKENAVKSTLFEDKFEDEFVVTTQPEDKLVEIEFLKQEVTSVEFGADVAVKVASLILSTFGEDVGIEFHPCGAATVHAGEGSTRVSINMPEDAEHREELFNLAIAAMGAINGYDAQKIREDEESEALDREALALHNAYYGDALDSPWTVDQLKADDPNDLEAFRRAAQAARRVYAQAVTTVAG